MTQLINTLTTVIGKPKINHVAKVIPELPPANLKQNKAIYVLLFFSHVYFIQYNSALNKSIHKTNSSISDEFVLLCFVLFCFVCFFNLIF